MKHMDDSGMRNLIAAIIIQGIKDLKSQNHQVKRYAKSFLLSENCELYCEVLGVSHNKLAKLIV